MMLRRNVRVRSLCGSREELVGRALFFDLTRVEEHDLARHVVGETHLVGRDEHRHAFGRELADEGEHLGHELGIERAGDLVEQHHARLHGERTHDGHPLLLASRQPVGVVVALVPHADAVEQRCARDRPLRASRA